MRITHISNRVIVRTRPVAKHEHAICNTDDLKGTNVWMHSSAP